MVVTCDIRNQESADSTPGLGAPGGDIRISNQFWITRALHFAQLRQAYFQASVIITLGRRV